MPVNPQRRLFPIRLLALFSGLGAAPQAFAKPALDVLLAQAAPPGVHPAGYLVSEKLDGVRALWDGTTLRFRSGRIVPSPKWFTARLPDTPLDGELWMARGKFDVLSGIVRKTQPVATEWRQVSYWVFELPRGSGTFESRAAQLQAIVKATGWPQLQAVPQERLANPAALQARLRTTVAAGGEGLMLHRADAPLATGRSDALLKLKPIQDAEAVVVGHVPGKGKFAGLLGALDVRTERGQRFRLGTGFTDAQRKSPPPIGSTVTYSYRDTTPGGKPRFASFLRVHDGI